MKKFAIALALLLLPSAALAQVIESCGVTKLSQSGTSYILGDGGPTLKYGGTTIVSTDYGAWHPIAAEAITGGFQVAWRSGTADFYTLWYTDSSGNFSSNPILNGVTGADPFWQNAQSSFQQNLTPSFSCLGPPPPPPTPQPPVASMPPFAPSYDCLTGSRPNLPLSISFPLDQYEYMLIAHDIVQPTLSYHGGSVIMLGDSITHGGDWSLIPGSINLAMRGDSTSGLINRMGPYNNPSTGVNTQGLTALHAAHAVVLLIGINDIHAGVSVAQIEANIQGIVNYLGVSCPIVMVKIFPTSLASDNAASSQINAWIQATFANRQRTVIVDTWPWMASGSPAAMSPNCPTWRGDGAHPVASCWMQYENAILAALTALGQQP